MTLEQQKKRKIDTDSHLLTNNNRNGNSYGDDDDDDDDDDMFGDDFGMDEIEQLEAMHVDVSLKPETNGKPSQDSNSCTVPENTDMPMKEDPDDEFDELLDQEIPLDQWIQFADINNLPPERPARKKYTRYVVINVTYDQYTVNDTTGNQKTLLLIEPETDASLHAHLRGDWFHTLVSSGDIVHIPFIVETKRIVIDNDHHFIIINPDKLISCTSIADTHSCLRKAMLQMKIKQVGDYSEVLVHGNIIHAVLQHTLQTGVFEIEAIQEQIRVEVFNSLESLYAIDQDEETMLSSLYPIAEHIVYFGKTFINEHPQPQATPSNTLGVDVEKEMNCQTLAINNVLDIEEHLWSPTYGMKGMIDASVQIKMSPSNRVLAVPFELKTGKTSKFLTHRAQTLLYTLLMSDRYDIDIEAGVLYYSKDNTLYLIPSLHRDIRSLIIARNDLATSLSKQHSLPPMIRNLHQCQYCYVSDACLQYHKSKENGTEVSSGLYKFFDERTKHLTGKASEFFKHWWDLLDMEEIDYDHARREIWSQPAEWREMSGRCLANMVLDIDQSTIDDTLPIWHYCFVRQKDDKLPQLTSYLSPGDSIVVSSMDGHINLAMGFVHSSNKERIVLNLSEPLRNPPRRGENFDETNNQAFQGFLQFGADAKNFYSQRQTLYRIDKDEISAGMSLLRNNVVELCAHKTRPSVERLRELIIELEPPKFVKPKVKYTLPVSLNPDQKQAVERVLYTQDYCLILGMPGTGKTTTITEIVKVLLERGNSILITAHTHTALDNVLSKLKSSGIDLLRLGSVNKVMPELKDCVPKFDHNVSSVELLRKQLGSKKVVGVTCLGIGHVMLQRKQFDYCIVDEASQITLPTCIGPLRYASKFVLVGDQYQLPPIVRDDNAKKEGLAESLFELLAESHPEAVTYLQYQYRMNKDIMELPNALIYGNRLRCGTSSIADRKMEVPRLHDGLKHIHQTSSCIGQCWLVKALHPDQKVLFVNTDPLLEVEETAEEGSLRNDKEAKLVADTIQALVHCGVPAQKLAVISFYRSQLRLITSTLDPSTKGVELSTVDKYQGRDKDCVIISLVRNNSQGNAGDLLRDWRRLNVAFTRAKSKLIIFGSVSTLKLSALYQSLIEILESKNRICEVNERTSTHIFDSVAFEEEYKKKEHRTFSPTLASLKKQQILKDLYEED